MRKFKRPAARLKRRRLAALAVACAALVTTTVVGTPSPASASGGHCVWWGQMRIGDYAVVAGGNYCFTVVGSGLHVDGTESSLSTGWINNPVEVVRFYDNHNTNYSSWTTHEGVGQVYGVQGWSSPIQGYAKTGRACGTLMSSGVDVATACISIYP